MSGGIDSPEYKAFRTGLTFGEVRRMLWTSDPDPKKWRYKRRHTVLGLWRQLKVEMWREKERREDEEVRLADVEEEKRSVSGRRSPPPQRRPRPARRGDRRLHGTSAR